MSADKDHMAILLFGEEDFLKRLRHYLAIEKLDTYEIPLTCKQFNNFELHAHVERNIRRKNVYIVMNFLDYSTGFDPNVGYMRLFIANDACRRASAAEINDILPYIPYLRQDRKDQPRVPISAKLFANLIEKSGADRVVTMDMHVDQIQGFYDKPVDHFTALPLFAEEFFIPESSNNDNNLFEVEFFKINAPIEPKEWVVVATDAGAMKRARDMKTLIHHKYKKDIDVAMLEKTRVNGKTEIHYLVGDVSKKNVIIVDDIIDTGGTLINGVNKLRKEGAQEIIVCATHGLLSHDAAHNLHNAGLKVIISDSIPRNIAYLEQNKDWLKVKSLAKLLVQGIHRIQLGDSVSDLFIDIQPKR